MPRRISDADRKTAAGVPVRAVIVTLDSHLAGAALRAAHQLSKDAPGLTLTLHAASDWAENPKALQRCKDDVAAADIIIASMLFVEDHIKAILPDLEARRDHCEALVCIMSASEVVKLTRIGKFVMCKPQSGAISFLKRLKPSNKSGKTAGANQMAMLKRIPRILRFIPGTAQDARAFFLTMQYWLACSDENLANMIRMLVDRYAAGPRAALKGALSVAPPVEYPETGMYHPDAKPRITDDMSLIPRKGGSRPTVGLLLMRSYILGGDTGHYDGVIRALEARGVNVIPAFAAGLDARPAVETFFVSKGKAMVDVVVSLTGFSLVGGPAFNDSRAAEEMLRDLDVPCLSGQALEFQTLDQWKDSERGLLPVESTVMLAIPELDGAISPIVYGGRTSKNGTQVMTVDPERADRLAERVSRVAELRRAKTEERRIAIVLFNFPPNAGATGTAAHLAVFESLFNTLTAMKREGYTVDLPASIEALRDRLLNGNADQHGADANVHATVSADDHVRSEAFLEEIEAQWGPAPGRALTDGRRLFIQGAQFGNVFVGVQPGFGYEGDPMRLLFESGFAPTHAFSAFYRYIKDTFAAHGVLHFGTHGALEFMPGKQTGLGASCWPDRLIGDLPNFYLYAANNPSEGTIAKRRSGATLVSHLTPPLTHAGLYKGLVDLKTSLERWRALEPGAQDDRNRLAPLIQSQAAAVDLVDTVEPEWSAADAVTIDGLVSQVAELELTLIPYGLHVVGQAPSDSERRDFLAAMHSADDAVQLPESVLDGLADGVAVTKLAKSAGLKRDKAAVAAMEKLATSADLLREDHELDGILRALDGRFVPPVTGGDLLRTPEILPTGRNLHGFDPFRIPSAFAVKDGAEQADLLLERHMADGNPLPESIALVLWGTDNLKTEGGPIGQALALMGAKPRFDSFGRLAGAELIALQDLERPRIDVAMTLSGIFRDLLPLQTKLLAEAAYLAAAAEEPEELNFIRKHALAYQARHDCDLETAALRVFGNDDGAYGSNVNHMVDGGTWEDEEELGDVFTKRKGFAYGLSGKPIRHEGLLQDVLSNVQLAYQNLESVEVGVTSIDHYFDSLGGVTRAVGTARGETVPVYIGDQTQGSATVRTLSEQVALETRSRTLNPAWYEGMLKHGYEGVRQIEAHLTNTVGWSATTGQVTPWVYKQITETFVLDPEMRRRMAELNPKASARVANRLLEAHERNYWTPDPDMLAALQEAGDELEDRLEGINAEAVA